jgi:GNAT superfamily N-acetyltransferase
VQPDVSQVEIIDLADPNHVMLQRVDQIIMRAYGSRSRLARVRRFIGVDGGGWVVLAVDDDVVATGGYIGYPEGGYGWIGLVATDPERQGRGLGTMVTRVLVDRLSERGCRPALDGSNAGAPVYERMGFTDHGLSHRYVAGLAPASPLYPGLDVETLKTDDLDAVARYDAHAFGGARKALLRYLIDEFPGRSVVIRRDGRIVGYGVAQDDCIGPVVADDEPTATVLLTSLLALPWSAPPALVMPGTSRYAGPLEAMGFTLERSLRHQRLGIDLLPGQRELICAQTSFGEG